MKLAPIAIDDYVAGVLPQSYEIWSERRSFERYVADFRLDAASTYAKSRVFTTGVREGGAIVCSCKNYERELRAGTLSLRATGIGAIFTAPQWRGRGYATAMLGALLDAERATGADLAFLYSDIHPIFYERLGFTTLPSREFRLQAATLDGSRSGAVPIESSDWPAVRRCFEALDCERPWSLKRTLAVWSWMRSRWDAPTPENSQPVALAVRRGRSISAYVIGRRVLREDTFSLDDCAFQGAGGRAVLPALLRAGAGDLRRVSGWLPPAGVREVLPRSSIRARKDAIFMLTPLSASARAWWQDARDTTLASRADPTWNADHI